MNQRFRQLLLGIGLVTVFAPLVLEGCQRRVVQQDMTPEFVSSTPGPVLEEGRLRAASGCEFDYTLFHDATGKGLADIVLAHGFLRERGRMTDLAQALAAAGLTTVAIDLCNMRPWNGAHRDNALEMRRVAARLGVQRPLYVGFSAGGLAALLAASEDSDAAGALTLDLVDQEGMGRRAAVDLTQPIIGLFGDASRCNADLNGLGAIEAAPHGEIIRIDGATHCDFESPTDGLCRFVCESADRSEAHAAERRTSIIEQVVRSAKRLLSAQASEASTP